jgi:hypothetical protein
VWHRLFEWVAQSTQALSSQWDTWRGHRVALIDGTCVSMAEEPALRAAFGSCRSKGREGRYPLARMVTLALANTLAVIGHAVGRYQDSEPGLMWPLLETLSPGDLLVGDRRFAAAHYYARYRTMGLEFITRKHHRLRLSKLKVLWRLGPNDVVAVVCVNPVSRRKDPSLPATVTVRVIGITACVRGRCKAMWLVTSLLDGELYPAAEIAARLITLNLVRTLMMEAAQAEGVDPWRISYAETVRVLLAFSPPLAAVRSGHRLLRIYRAMLHEISLHLVPERPGRNEPRMARREKKHYPTLRTTRKQWRLTNAA